MTCKKKITQLRHFWNSEKLWKIHPRFCVREGQIENFRKHVERASVIELTPTSGTVYFRIFTKLSEESYFMDLSENKRYELRFMWQFCFKLHIRSASIIFISNQFHKKDVFTHI